MNGKNNPQKKRKRDDVNSPADDGKDFIPVLSKKIKLEDSLSELKNSRKKALKSIIQGKQKSLLPGLVEKNWQNSVLKQELAIEKFLAENSLHSAAEQEDTKLMERLLDAGADIDSKDENGETALQASLFGGCIKSVRFLLENGADATSLKISDYCKFDCNFTNHEIKNLLIIAGAKSDHPQDKINLLPIIQTVNKNEETKKDLKHLQNLGKDDTDIEDALIQKYIEASNKAIYKKYGIESITTPDHRDKFTKAAIEFVATLAHEEPPLSPMRPVVNNFSARETAPQKHSAKPTVKKTVTWAEDLENSGLKR